MRSVLKVAISFGLVNIPVAVFPATTRKDVSFHLLHSRCQTPIKYRYYCPTCDKDIARDETVRGYEYEKSKYAVITDEELDNIPLESRRIIEITDFIDREVIDPIYFDKSYYLEPQETGEKAYALLCQAMQKAKKVAVAKVTMRGKEYLTALRNFGSILLMATLFYSDEINIPRVVIPPHEVKILPGELEMAVQLINTLSGKFEPQKYHDQYREALLKMIQEKIEGKEAIKAPVRKETAGVMDLMEALKKSVEIGAKRASSRKK